MKIRGINEPSADPVRPMRREVLRYCVGATVMISIPGASFAGVRPRNVVVETAHGRLSVHSEPGLGAVFMIDLPLNNPADPTEVAPG